MAIVFRICIHADNFTNYVLRLFSAAFMLLMMAIPSIIAAVFSCIQISDNLHHYDTVISAFMLTMTSLKVVLLCNERFFKKLKPKLLLISVRTKDFIYILMSCDLHG